MPALDWLNRVAAFGIADRVPARMLQPVSSHGDGSPSATIDDNEGRCRSTTKEQDEELREDIRICFGRDSEGMAQGKRFRVESEATFVPWTRWPHDETGENREAMREANELVETIGPLPLATPKPEHLLERVVDLATDRDDLVLDSFLGSGATTAVAHKVGRHWIGIEMGEHAVTHCLPPMEKVAGEPCRLGSARLDAERIVVRQIPYELAER